MTCTTRVMLLYSAVRVLRGVALGVATHSVVPAAVVAEVTALVPLAVNASRTYGEVLAVSLAGEFRGRMLEILEAPMRGTLRVEAVVLLISIFVTAVHRSA